MRSATFWRADLEPTKVDKSPSRLDDVSHMANSQRVGGVSVGVVCQGVHVSIRTYESADDLLPIGDTARILGVSVPTIRRWEAEGKITGTRTLGGQRRFTRSEIERVRSGSAA